MLSPNTAQCESCESLRPLSTTKSADDILRILWLVARFGAERTLGLGVLVTPVPPAAAAVAVAGVGLSPWSEESTLSLQTSAHFSSLSSGPFPLPATLHYVVPGRKGSHEGGGWEAAHMWGEATLSAPPMESALLVLCISVSAGTGEPSSLLFLLCERLSHTRTRPHESVFDTTNKQSSTRGSHRP